MRLAAENARHLRNPLGGDGAQPLAGRAVLDIEMFGDPGQPEGAETISGGEGLGAHAPVGYPGCPATTSVFGTLGNPHELVACNDDDMANTLRYRIATLRIDRGEQQADLAAAVGCARSMISAIETGRKEPGRELLFAIAKHYGVSADWLQTGQDDPADDLAELINALRNAAPEVVEAVRLMLKAAKPARR